MMCFYCRLMCNNVMLITQVMREEAAANEALLIDFGAIEAAKAAAAGGGEAGACAAGWVPPAAPAFQPFPSIPPPAGGYPGYPGYGPMDAAMNAPPPPYGGGYPMPPQYQPQETKPAAPPASPPGPVVNEKKSLDKQDKQSPSFNIPPNNLSSSSNNSLPSSTETSPAAGNKPSNMNNLQV